MSFTALDLSLSPRGEGLLVATDHHRVILLQAGTEHQVRNFYNLVNDGYSTPRVAWSPSGKYGYVSCQDKSVAILDIATGKTAASVKGHEVNVRGVAVHPTRNWMLSCSFDKTCRVWTPDVQ